MSSPQEKATDGAAEPQPLITTPKLVQNEFPNLSTDFTKQKYPSRIDCYSNESTPNGNVDMLPTPTTNTATSPVRSSVSPVHEGSLRIEKRRNADEGDSVLTYLGATDPSKLKTGSGIIEEQISKLGTYTSLDGKDASSARVVSDYIPASLKSSAKVQRSISLTSKRPAPISSLKKETIFDETHTAIPSCVDEESSDGGSIIQGYMIDGSGDVSHRWRKVKEIGSGNFSTVYLYEMMHDEAAEIRPELAQVAVKSIKYPQELLMTSSPSSPKYKELLSRVESSLKRELTTLISLNHPCVVKLFAINDVSFINEDHPLQGRPKFTALPRCDAIMSYCAGGDLFDLASKVKIPDWLCTRIIAELSIGIKYLHDSLVIHRDIKLENVLMKYPLNTMLAMHADPNMLSTKSLVELADFGLCKKIAPDELCTTRCGSEDYVSPEILLGLPYDGRISDSWGFGVIIYALLEDRLPFDPIPGQSSRRTRSVAHRIARCDWKWFRMADVDHPAKELVENTLVRKTERWDMTKICNTPYIRSVTETFKFVKNVSPSK